MIGGSILTPATSPSISKIGLVHTTLYLCTEVPLCLQHRYGKLRACVGAIATGCGNPGGKCVNPENQLREYLWYVGYSFSLFPQTGQHYISPNITLNSLESGVIRSKNILKLLYWWHRIDDCIISSHPIDLGCTIHVCIVFLVDE